MKTSCIKAQIENIKKPRHRFVKNFRYAEGLVKSLCFGYTIYYTTFQQKMTFFFQNSTVKATNTGEHLI